jgi:formylglycine-generating enzyme required for sulfatase activity
MEAAAQPFRDGSAAGQREALGAEVAALEREVSVRRTFRFDDREKEWWNTQLSGLVRDLEEIQRRIVLAERSVSSPEAMARWRDAIDAIARSEVYGGLRLSPQLELLPLGPDPDSGLWEFAHLGTGEAPRRGSDRVLVLEPETGIVFVLLPAGHVPVEDRRRSTPVNDVLLDAFFLSKYEMTVAQWTRTSRWTGRFNRDAPLLPADGVSWNDCVATLGRAGLFLRLPTEAQWEYGCRAETTTRWWTGETEDTLVGAACVDLGSRSQLGEPRPVGELAANPFGLHDVHGNVWEWCHDEFGDEDARVRPGDGEHTASGKGVRVYRGGGYTNGGSSRVGGVYAPTTLRLATYPEDRFGTLGVRVARSVTP